MQLGIGMVLGAKRKRCYSLPEITNEVRNEGLGVEEISERWSNGLTGSDHVGAKAKRTVESIE